ncbi:universal stress protein [Amycolatopsis sp. NPDC004747]
MSASGNAPVVVAVDGSETAASAALWAAGEAARRHASLLVFTAYGYEATAFGGKVFPPSDWLAVKEAEAIAWAFEEASLRNAPLAFQGESLRDSGQRLLAQRLAGWQEKYPDVTVERRVERDKPRHRLLSAGRGGFTGLVLGSTSQALLHHAACPVMVVRTGNA